MLNKFQYISCYSLSNKEIEHVSGEVMFQYISCYSLSWNKVFRLEENISFNTSHVTLYLHLAENYWILLSGFNTSHVTLYHGFSSNY